MLLLVAVFALPVSGQVEHSKATDVPKTAQKVSLPYTPRLPFTATFKITQTKPQDDGSTITQEWTEVRAWSSQRRMMKSITTIPQSDDQTPTTNVVVVDRAAHTISRWSVPGQQVTVTKQPPAAPGTVPCAAILTLGLVEPTEISPLVKVPHGRPVNRDLGIQTIQEVEARGGMTTWVTRSGAVGNNEPLIRTREIWLSTKPGLNLLVRVKTSDPLLGKTTRELEDLNLNEPSPMVFQPPANYEVVQRDAPECPAPRTNGERPASRPQSPE
jgi:hypothetical protein